MAQEACAHCPAVHVCHLRTEACAHMCRPWAFTCMHLSLHHQNASSFHHEHGLSPHPHLATAHRYCSYQTLEPLFKKNLTKPRFAALVVGAGASTFPETLYDWCVHSHPRMFTHMHACVVCTSPSHVLSSHTHPHRQRRVHSSRDTLSIHTVTSTHV